jgi:FixJ family two-component response regulator
MVGGYGLIISLEAAPYFVSFYRSPRLDGVWMNPTVYLVDDDQSFRTATSRLLEASGYRVVSFRSSAEFLAHPVSPEAGCILLDLEMPDINGLELQHALEAAVSLLPIVFLTGHGNIEVSVQAMKAGAEDFLQKPVPREALLDAVERAFVISEKRRDDNERKLSLETRVANLSPREIQVFRLVVRGKRNKQIAFELGTSERTVKGHRQSIMAKLEVKSLAEAVSVAERWACCTPTGDSGASGPPEWTICNPLTATQTGGSACPARGQAVLKGHNSAGETGLVAVLEDDASICSSITFFMRVKLFGGLEVKTDSGAEIRFATRVDRADRLTRCAYRRSC